MSEKITEMVICTTCSRYYSFDDDCGQPLCQGCKLDLPHFHPHKAIVCSSHIQRGSRLDN